MRVLVTGGAGYVGSRLVTHLLRRGFEVTAFDRLDFGAVSLMPLLQWPGFALVQGDIRDRDALGSQIQDHDAVVMLAAIVGEPACLRNPIAAEQINRDAAIAALRQADSLGVERFVFFSTCSNYGVVDPQASADEETPLNPISLYAQTKVEVERLALAEHHRMAVTILRLGTICGLSARMRFDLLVNDLARSAVLGRPIELYQLQAWRPFLHIDDVGPAVEQILGAADSAVRDRVFNIVGENHQKTALAEIVRKHFPHARIAVTDGQADNRDYRVSAERVKCELGFIPAHTVEEAFVSVARAVADGFFVDPFWEGHCAIPLRTRPASIAV